MNTGIIYDLVVTSPLIYSMGFFICKSLRGFNSFFNIIGVWVTSLLHRECFLLLSMKGGDSMFLPVFTPEALGLVREIILLAASFLTMLTAVYVFLTKRLEYLEEKQKKKKRARKGTR